MPDLFIQAVRQKSVIAFSTEDLISLNDRNKEVLQEVYLITNQVSSLLFYELSLFLRSYISQVCQNLLTELRQHLSVLFAVVESIALVDMLLCFAHLVTLSDQYGK